MPTRNVVLTDRQTALVARLVDSGRYRNASEAIREGLRLLERREIEEESRLKAMREAVSVGVADIEAGRFREFDAAGPLRDRLSMLAEEALRAARSDGGR